MRDFICRQNVAHYRELLLSEIDDAKRTVVEQLLREQEARLGRRTVAGPGRSQD